jgi:hypothetical protein
MKAGNVSPAFFLCAQAGRHSLGMKISHEPDRGIETHEDGQECPSYDGDGQECPSYFSPGGR